MEKGASRGLENPKRSKYFSDKNETESDQEEMEEEDNPKAALRGRKAKPKKTTSLTQKLTTSPYISTIKDCSKDFQPSTTSERKKFQRKIYEALIKLREKVSCCMFSFNYKICFRDKIPPRVFLTNQNINDLSINTPASLTSLSEFDFMGN